MFEVHCPRHGTRVLLSEGRIRGIANTDTGIVVGWRCWCGFEGETRTGRRRPVPECGRSGAPLAAEPPVGAQRGSPRNVPASPRPETAA